MWMSRSWKLHFPISLTPGLQSWYTWRISRRTWVHTPAPLAISAGKSGCWNILVGVIIKSPCSIPTKEALGKPVLKWYLGSHSWEFSLDLFPRLFQWSCKYHIPCVKSPSAYTVVCSLTCLRQSAGPLGWPSGVRRSGSGRSQLEK